MAGQMNWWKLDSGPVVALVNDQGHLLDFVWWSYVVLPSRPASGIQTD